MTTRQFSRPIMEFSEKPWERMREENEASYNAFCAYLETPKRGHQNPRRYVEDTAKGLGRAAGGLHWLFNEHHWEQRAAAYDEHITLHPQALYHLEERRKLAAQLREDAEKFREKAKKELMLDGLVLKPEDAIKLYKLAVDLEREAHRMEQPVTAEQEKKLNQAIRDAVNRLTAGLGELASRGEGAAITATRERVAIELGAEGGGVRDISNEPGDLRPGRYGPEVVEQTD